MVHSYIINNIFGRKHKKVVYKKNWCAKDIESNYKHDIKSFIQTINGFTYLCLICWKWKWMINISKLF